MYIHVHKYIELDTCMFSHVYMLAYVQPHLVAASGPRREEDMSHVCACIYIYIYVCTNT